MEDTEEFRWALKVVIKRQMRDLVSTAPQLQQLHDVGEEMAVLSVNTFEGTVAHFGTNHGEWFLSEQKNLKENFLKYCQSVSKKSDPGRKSVMTPIIESLNASITSDSERYQESPGRRKGDERPAFKGKRPQPVYVESKSPKAGNALIKIRVPKGMITSGTSDKDLSGLVGRLLDQELKSQKSRSDAAGNDSQEKFSSLLEAANIAKEQVQKTLGKRPATDGAQSVAKRTRSSGTESPEKGAGDTPRHSLRSGRAVSTRFLEGIASLKPKTASKGKDDKGDTDEEHADPDQSDSVALEGTELETVSAQLSKELEQMTLPVLEKLESATSTGESFDNREIKVVVTTVKEESEETGENISVEMETESRTRIIKRECSSDEDQNYDQDWDSGDEYESEFKKYIKNDPDNLANAKAVSVVRGMPLDDKDDTQRRRAGAGREEELKPRPKKNRYTDKMIVECPHCGTKIVGKSNLQSHIKRVHLKVKKFPCTICSKPFWSNNARESHMLSVHTRQCDDCSEYVVESVPWGEGIDMRSKRDVICTCGSIVSIFSQFGRSKMYHDNIDEDESLRRRKKAGESGTKYACGTCGKLFQKRSQCERHSLTHAGVKVFVCDHCGNQYSYQSSLSKHLVNEHGITRFICDYCGKNFTKESMLKAHMVKMHNYSLTGTAIYQQITNEEDSQTLGEEAMSVEAVPIVAGAVKSDIETTILVSGSNAVSSETAVDTMETTVQELGESTVQEMPDHTVLKIGDGHIAVVLHQPE